MRRLSGQIDIIVVGKLRTRHWKAAQEEYLKRLQRYTRVKLIEVKDAVGQGIPDAVAMQQEGDLLLKASENASRRLALTPTGTQFDSLAFAGFLQKQVVTYGHLAFLIGGPLGFAPEVLAACHGEVALSTLTFTHELARVILLEQLYRAATIVGGEKYHK